MKSALIQFKVEPRDKSLFERAAQLSGEKLSEFFYRAGRDRLRILMGKTPVQDNTFDEFVNYLKSKPKVRMDAELRGEVLGVSARLERGELKTVSSAEALRTSKKLLKKR